MVPPKKKSGRKWKNGTFFTPFDWKRVGGGGGGQVEKIEKIKIAVARRPTACLTDKRHPLRFTEFFFTEFYRVSSSLG